MKESEIRPPALFAEYLKLNKRDAERFFDFSEATPRPCPGCGGESTLEVFIKDGFPFRECSACGTLFQSPTPPHQQFERFYTLGEATRYWADVFAPAVMEERRKAIVHPRVERITEICGKENTNTGTCLDVGSAHGVFLEEWRRRHSDSELFSIEPNPIHAEACRAKGITVLETTGEKACREWQEVAGLVTSFEVIEHVRDPLDFVRSLYELTKPSGLSVVTGLGCEGFDVQVLWEQAACICPPSHINFCSVAGFEALFKRAGFESVRVFTPGVLDTEIVSNIAKVNNLTLSRFERLLLSRGKDTLAEFQAFLSRNALSSHTWIVARRGH